MSSHWDRRKNKDRRKKDKHLEYPFKDAQEKLVTYDRRSSDNRRMGIQVSQELISEEEFEELLHNTKANKRL
jgi:hypothetical protein